MFSNLKAKKRITQLLIAVVAIAITVTGSAFLLNDFVQEAKAAEYTVTTADEWRDAVKSGDTNIIIKLGSDLVVSSKLEPIPSGVTVTLNMSGNNIKWYDVDSGNDGIISRSFPYANTYWGLITNNGTLSIESSGMIASHHIRYGNSNDDEGGAYGSRVAAIVNAGTLTVGSSIKIESYVGQANNSGDNYQHLYTYSIGIYNTGTVSFGGIINSGAYAGGTVNYGTSSGSGSDVVSYAYGIFGGNVVMTGGRITTESLSGYLSAPSTLMNRYNSVDNFAIGIYSNNATILGNSSISTNATSWRNYEGNNCWENGKNMSWGIGVMYSGTNYPNIGADVSIDASYTFVKDSKYVGFPNTSSVAEYNNKFGHTVGSESGPGSYGRKAYAVAGISANMNSAMYGEQSSQTAPHDGAVFGVSTEGSPSNSCYRSELLYRNNSTSYVKVASSENKSATGGTDGGTYTSWITMGAPGSGSGGQYMVYYRYKDVSGTKITAASITPNETINSKIEFTPTSGVFTSGGVLTKTENSGNVKNENFYKFVGTFFDGKGDGAFGTGANCDKLNSINAGESFTDLLALTAGKSYYIWAEYQALAATNVNIVAADKGVNLDKTATSTSFSTVYTGKQLVPGEDFAFAVLDTEFDENIQAANYSKYELATDFYKINPNVSDDSKVPLTYYYKNYVNNDSSKEDLSTYTMGLPTNVGKYTIAVVVPSDIDIKRPGAGNHNGGTFYLTATIKQATPTIGGDLNKSGTYGSTMAELIPTTDFTITGLENDQMTGNWSYEGFAYEDYPTVAAASKTITLKWTPTGECATNYKAVSTTVNLKLAKRDVTVTPADSNVTYGSSSPKYELSYKDENGKSTLAVCDETKTSEWLANSTFEVNYNGTWQAYSSTMIPGKYQMRIASFGGDTANNNFTYSGTSTLTINKAPLYYTATATNKIYDGKAEVNVNLNYTAGAVNGDSYSATLTTKGTLENANAGENKAVTVVTDGLDYTSNTKYYIAIQNSPVVTISKATPEVTVEGINLEYDVTNSLSKIAINGSASHNGEAVSGLLSWEDSGIVPTVNVRTYRAKFTPANTTNYNTVYVDVPINVTPAEVTVRVEDMTITYGESPSLKIEYLFPDNNDIKNIETTGTVVATTPDYSRGNDAGTYTIKVTSNEFADKDGNYVFKTDESTLTVVKKNITVTAPSTTSTYGDSVAAFNWSQLIVDEDALYEQDSLEELNKEVTFKITTTHTQESVVGSYPVVVTTEKVAKNYEFTFVNGAITVEKAVLNVIAIDKTITFGQAKPNNYDYKFEGYKFEGETKPTGKPSFSTSYVKGNNAGKYDIVIDEGTLKHDNYKFNFVKGTLYVEKLTITPSSDVEATITHGEKYSDAVFNGNTITDSITGEIAAGTFALDDPDTLANYVNANEDMMGVRYVPVSGVFTPAQSDNYNQVAVNVILTINPHAVTGAPVITGTVMETVEISASVAGMSPDQADKYDFEWYAADTIGGVGAVIGSGQSYTVKAENIDKYIYVTATAKENNGYTGSKSSVAVKAVKFYGIEVDESNIDTILRYSIENVVYDGEMHAASVDVADGYKDLVGDISVYYNGSDEVPVNAGTYVVTIDISEAEAVETKPNDCYRPVSGYRLGEITIEKATVTAIFEVKGKTYDGTRNINSDKYKYNIEGVVSKDNGNVNLDTSAISIAFATPAAGVQDVEISGIKLIGDASSNYKLEIEDATATIARKQLTATARGVTREYNKTAVVDVELTLNVNDFASIDSTSTVYVDYATAVAMRADAGTWNMFAYNCKLGGTSAENYDLVITNEGSAQVTINRAAIVVAPPTVTGIEYDAARTLSQIELEKYYNKDGTGEWQFDNSTSVIPTVKKVQYAATFVPTDKNYADYKTYITVNVTPKTVTLTAVDTTVSYGKAAAYSVKADGFTGNDSLATMAGTQPVCSCTYGEGSNIGDYIIRVVHNLDSNGNYIFETVNGTLTVVPAELYVSATATDREYNGSTGVEVKFAITSGKYSNDDVALSVTSANGVASSANAGTRTVSYTAPTLTGSKANNYKIVLSPASGILTVNINKLDPTGYVFPTSATIPFGYALSWAQFSDDAKGDGTFAFSKKNEVPDIMGSNYSFEVVFTPTDATNYNTVSKYIPLTVTECVVNYVVGVTGTPQVGQKLSVTFTGLPTKAYEYVQYQWYRDTDNGAVAISGANTSTYTATENDVGYEIFCLTYFNAGDPYVFEDGVADIIGGLEGIFGSTSGSIEEENLTFWQRLVRWIESIIQAITGIMWSF